MTKSQQQQTNQLPDSAQNISRWDNTNPGTPNYCSNRQDQFIDLKNIKLKHKQWLLEGVFPIGETTIIAGLPGCGKTTLLSFLCGFISNEASMAYFSRSTKQMNADIHGRVLFVAFEDDVSTTIAHRLYASNPNDSLLSVYTKANNSFPNTKPQKTTNKLIELIKQFKDVKALLLDNIDILYSDHPETRQGRKNAMREITALSRKMGFAIIANAHTKQMPIRSANPLNQIIGGSALGSEPRNIFFINEIQPIDSNSNQREFLLYNTKHSIGDTPPGLLYTIENAEVKYENEVFKTSKIKWLNIVEPEEIDAILPSQMYLPVTNANEREKAEALIQSRLANGPCTTDELNSAAKAMGLSEGSVSRARKFLNVKTKKLAGHGQRSGWIVWLPGGEAINQLDDVSPPTPDDDNSSTRQLDIGKNGHFEPGAEQILNGISE